MRINLVYFLLLIFVKICCGFDDFFIECDDEINAHLFNGTETITTFEIPISAFFPRHESEQLINATAEIYQKQAREIVEDITLAHEQEIMEIIKQFKSTRRKRFLGLRSLFSKLAHSSKRIYPRAESGISKSLSPQKTFEGSTFVAKTSSSAHHVEKMVRGAKWAAKTSAQLGALYAATVVYDKLTGSSENFEILKNATNFTLIKSTIDSSLNYAKNEKIHDLKMLLFFQRLNHLPFIIDYLQAIKSGWTDVVKMHVKDDAIVIETKTKFYSLTGKLCKKHFIGSFENGDYSYNATLQFIDDVEVQNCELNIFDEMFCFTKTFIPSPINVTVNHCYRRRTKTKIFFVTKTENYFENDIEKEYPSSGILVAELKDKSDLIIPLCGIFSLRHNEEHFHSYQKTLYTEEILKMNQKLEEIEKKTTENQQFFAKLAKLFQNDFILKICVGILAIAITASLLFCLIYLNFVCICRKIIHFQKVSKK